MHSPKDIDHTYQVDVWIKQNANGLPAEQLLIIFTAAIRAIQKRAATTLSEVTLTAIFNRILYTCQKKFPLLSETKTEQKDVSFDKIVEQARGLQPDEITNAFRFFLIELLTILGNLTANILTQSLYRELTKVTAKDALQKAGYHGLRSIKSSSERRNK